MKSKDRPEEPAPSPSAEREYWRNKARRMLRPTFRPPKIHKSVAWETVRELLEKYDALV